MSRVIYANTQATVGQEELRTTHQVRLIDESQEGTGVNALPPGVYGFTYSPALPNAPLFADRRFRSYEIHKLANGDILIVGFVSTDDARLLEASAGDIEIRMQPEPEVGAEVLVMIPYSRILHHRQYAVRTEHGISLQVGPATT